MDNLNHFSTNLYFITIFFWSVMFSVMGNPTPNTIDSRSDNLASLLDCIPEEHAPEDVIVEKNGIFLKKRNITIYPGQYQTEGEKILICQTSANINSEETTLNCSKFEYNSTEYEILPNNSALLFGDIIPPDEYELKDDILSVCDDGDAEYPVDDGDSSKKQSNGTMIQDSAQILVGQIGSFISIIALILYLLAFCMISSLRNLPGYNLASLSVAFILAYSFHLIGQIPEVLGLSCIISGVLKLNFFLTAFFCMNVLAFDVWRTMKLATVNLIVQSHDTRKRQFIWYSLYAWGCPMVICAFSVIFDNSDKIPDNVKPKYGNGDICDLTTYNGQIIFSVTPAFTLILINVFFFFRTFWMISSNKFKNNDTQNDEKFNYVLYLRLGIMMGMTWLIGVIGLISNSRAIWVIYDLVNSLQGLLLFLLFTCRKRVIQHLREKTSPEKFSMDRKTTAVSNFSNLSSSN